MTSPQESFAFIFNNLEPAFSEELEIIPQHIFRKARAEEVEKIKEIIVQIGPLFIPEKSLPYEVKWEKSVNGNSYLASILPEKDWRYYVIVFQGTNSEIQELGYASSLIKNHLDFGLIFINFTPPIGLGTYVSPDVQNTFNYYCDYLNPLNMKPSCITKEELCSIEMYYNSIKALSHDGYLYKAIENLGTLKNIPRKSDLLILGYFAIIESIITHEPRSKETLDSINHQFTNKLTLLRKRFTRPLDYSQYFQEGKEATIWKKLYDYRSCLAHGDNPDFSKIFTILKDKLSVFSFIHETLKLTIIAALKEPDLISDLRNC